MCISLRTEPWTAALHRSALCMAEAALYTALLCILGQACFRAYDAPARSHSMPLLLFLWYATSQRRQAGRYRTDGRISVFKCLAWPMALAPMLLCSLRQSFNNDVLRFLAGF